MADIVNGGIIVLMAALGLAAVVGGADELRSMAGPAPDRADDPATVLGNEAGPPQARDGKASLLDGTGLDDDRGDRGDDRGGKADRGDKRDKDRDDRGDRGHDEGDRHHDRQDRDGDDEHEDEQEEEDDD